MNGIQTNTAAVTSKTYFIFDNANFVVEDLYTFECLQVASMAYMNWLESKSECRIQTTQPKLSSILIE